MPTCLQHNVCGVNEQEEEKSKVLLALTQVPVPLTEHFRYVVFLTHHNIFLCSYYYLLIKHLVKGSFSNL